MRASILTIVLCGVVHPAHAQAVIGDASRAVNAVTGAIGARRAAIVTGSNVHQNETVSTGPAAEADLLFLDKTALHVASASSVKLDRYVYNSDGSARGAVMSMARGAFRFTTGQSSPAAFRLQTPHALIGIRGTVLEIDVGRGVTQVTLTQGAADICLRSNPRSCATLDRPGQAVRVSNTSLNGDGVRDNPARTQPTQRASAGSDTALVAQMVSQHRAANGFSAVQLDSRLVRLAQSQADAMAQRTSMSHDVSGDFDARMSGAGVRGWSAENIAAGYNSVIEVFSNWQVSDKHNANMLHPHMRKIGLARSVGSDGRVYWAMVLASK
ncbi:MAG: CAP domain-containing protein [Beijerinckiaceae bacterium]